jgi:hypothetical protein
MCSLLTETISINLLKGGDTEQLKNDRAITLAEQAKILTLWCLRFDVQKKNEEMIS